MEAGNAPACCPGSVIILAVRFPSLMAYLFVCCWFRVLAPGSPTVARFDARGVRGNFRISLTSRELLNRIVIVGQCLFKRLVR